MASLRAERRLAAILAADVVGYSRLMERDESGTLERLKAHRKELIDPLLAEHHARIVKLMGDGALCEFGSIVDAVSCAVLIQRGMIEREKGIPEDERIRFRIGVNLGDVIVESDDIYGDGVNVAARLEQLAKPGGICVSGTAYDHLRGKLACGLEDLGERQVKNIERPVRVYRMILGEEIAPPEPPLPNRPSLAVLPFENMSSDPEQGYFSDGISEDITTELSKISGLFVIARNSAFTYKGKAVDVKQVGKELGVRYVLEGSVRKAGNRVRVTAQLIDAVAGGHLWAERYDRDLTDIFAVQDEITREIVSALEVKLTRDERRRAQGAPGTRSVEAYECVLRGRELARRHTLQTRDEARPLLERAIELDPGFAAAHAELALLHVVDYVNGWSEDPEHSLKLGYRLAQKAVALEEAEPQAHFVLGVALLWMKHLDQALAEVRRAIELDPNLAHGHALLGNVLHYAGRSEEGLVPLHQAIRLDPYCPDVYLHFLAQSYFMLGWYEEAVTALRRRLERNTATDVSRVLLAACYGQLGRSEEARAEWAEALRINPAYSLEHRRRILPYADPTDFERVIEGLHKAGLLTPGSHGGVPHVDPERRS
jgi:adenylate cyclase